MIQSTPQVQERRHFAYQVSKSPMHGTCVLLYFADCPCNLRTWLWLGLAPVRQNSHMKRWEVDHVCVVNQKHVLPMFRGSGTQASANISQNLFWSGTWGVDIAANLLNDSLGILGQCEEPVFSA